MPQTEQEISVNISDELTLTPFAGASIVNEILKGLLYQKCQIPYPYSCLQHVIEKRRKKLKADETEPRKVNFTHENHYRIVSTLYDNLHLIMESINKEFCESSNTVKEIHVVFGLSPHCPKEVLTIVIPSIAKGHVESNHINKLNKHLQKVLRSLFLSQTWMDSIDASISCTNTYIYVKKQTSVNHTFTSEAFEPCQPLHVLTTTRHLKFFLTNNTSERTNCCEKTIVFDESEFETEKNKLNQQISEKSEEHIVWCRSKTLLKGFKDCFINKVSVCELW